MIIFCQIHLTYNFGCKMFTVFFYIFGDLLIFPVVAEAAVQIELMSISFTAVSDRYFGGILKRD